MINPNKIILEGFGSYIKETEFKLKRPGLNVIIAENGAGKTTVFSGLRWVTFGQSLKLKEVGTKDFLRPKDYKGTKVRFKFTDDKDNKYEIIRCQDYSGKVEGAKGGDRLILIENGVKSKIRNKADVQARINEILGYTDRLFMSSVLFGQRMKRLIEESGPDKKKTFEEAFETQFIKEGKDKADKKIKELKPKLSEADKNLAIAEKDIEITRNGIKSFKEAKARFIKDKQHIISNLEEDLQDYQTLLKQKKRDFKKSDLDKLYTKLDQVNGKLKNSSSKKLKEATDLSFKSQLRLNEMKGRVDDWESEIDSLKEAFKKVKKECPICGSKLSSENIKKEQTRLKKKISLLKEKIPNQLEIILDAQKELGLLEDRIASLKDNRDKVIELEKKKKDYESKISKHSAYQKEIEYSKERISDLKQKIEDAHELKFDIEDPGYGKKLKKFKKLRKDIKTIYKGISREIKDLTWISNEVLGNKGLKSYIFDTSLRNLNSYLRYYEQFIGWRIEFMIDFDSANKDIYALCYKGDNMFQYEELSGGQQQLVNIATAFALNDMTTAGKPINLLILDEVFESLDSSNVDIVTDLIKDKAKTKNLFLITHNITLQNEGDKVIRMKLSDKGQTLLKAL